VYSAVGPPSFTYLCRVKNFYLPFVAILALLASCANPIPPEGGPRDTAAPQIDDLKSTPDGQTNFKPEEITLYFNEWVKLNKINEQVLISPPLEFPPQFIHRGKEVTLRFNEEEVLRENTTYSIRFGEGIQDITENNAAEDLNFVFSTGPKLDSLQVTGRLFGIDRKTPAEAVLVMLYDSQGDSLPYLERPAYASKTDAEGKFTISNLRADTFTVVALKDENRNYTFDPATEEIAFMDSVYILTDTSSPFIRMAMFKEVPPFKLTERKLTRKRLIMKWEGRIDTTDMAFEDADVVRKEVWRDSLIYWYDKAPDSLRVILFDTDTVDIKKGRRPSPDTMDIEVRRNQMKNQVLTNRDTLQMVFNMPISWNGQAIWRDTAEAWRSLDTAIVKDRQLLAVAPWTTGSEHIFGLPAGSLEGINGETNGDTILYKFSVPEREKLGSIIFTLDSLPDNDSRVISLMDGDKVLYRFTASSQTGPKEVKVPHLRPGKYSVEIVVDENDNGEWDTGSYLEGRQPERRWSQELEPLRENWDLKVELQL
jgi:uncharacterized protein (DUF2141 family)